MTSIWRILQAFGLVVWAHWHQRDKAGKRYLWHLVRVAWLAYGLTGDTDAVVVGLLHDYIEDVDPAGLADLIRWFGFETASRVFVLSRNDIDTYAKYIDRLLNHDAVTRAVKIADLLHNTDPTRLAWPEDRGERNKTMDRLFHYQGALGRLIEQRTWSGRRMPCE